MHLTRRSFTHAIDALQREWLATNGLGGFASGTVALANTRRYHGLLVASLRPPVERVVMVAKVDATARYVGKTFGLACNEFADGTLTPRGFELLCGFEIDHGIPVWTYALADARLEERIWMEHGQNVSYMSFTLRQSSAPVTLDLVPLCTYRDYHAQAQGGWKLEVAPEERGCTVSAFPGARPYRILIDQGEFETSPDWYWRFYHRMEAERGLDALEDLFRPGILHTQLCPGETRTLIATAEPDSRERGAPSVEREFDRWQLSLSSVSTDTPDWVERLTIAADQFIVRRAVVASTSVGPPREPAGASDKCRPPGAGCSYEPSHGTTIIAGYPWFSDWGRDTMIALPGLAIATGRHADAASILLTFAEHTSQGMLPNRFPDGGEPAEYNTADATLWYFHAVEKYLEATGDQALLVELYPTLKEIIDWHRRGTRHGIHVDAADGLLYAGERGVQLTWMDAKIGDWVVTPRIGKPVEINALWHFALATMARWAIAMGDAAGQADYARAATRVEAAFAGSFWYAEGGYLYDVIDDPDSGRDDQGRQVDKSLRPNQILAVSLGTDLLDAHQARSVVDMCARELLTPVGLRSLAPSDARYIGDYVGGPRERDAAYHQGTAWSWLLGPFALAHYRVYGDAARATRLLAGLAAHVDEACIGTISEIFDGDPPHTPRGCFAQAWSVGETLRAWHTLARAQATDRIPHTRAAGART